MPLYRTKPVEAVRWDGNASTANKFIGERYGTDWRYSDVGESSIFFTSGAGDDLLWGFAKVGDWIVKNHVMGRFCSMDHATFEATYEKVE
jgi:hypothetical protein